MTGKTDMQRGAFEDWCKSALIPVAKNDAGFYLSLATDNMWLAWCAAIRHLTEGNDHG